MFYRSFLFILFLHLRLLHLPSSSSSSSSFLFNVVFVFHFSFPIDFPNFHVFEVVFLGSFSFYCLAFFSLCQHVFLHVPVRLLYIVLPAFSFVCLVLVFLSFSLFYSL